MNQDGPPVGVLSEGCILDNRQRHRLSVQIKIQGSNASMPVQRSQRADGECHRLGGMGQAGGTPFHELDCPGRHNTACRIQQNVPSGRPAHVGFSSGGFAPLPFFLVSIGTVSGSKMGNGGFLFLPKGQRKVLRAGSGRVSVSGLV